MKKKNDSNDFIITNDQQNECDDELHFLITTQSLNIKIYHVNDINDSGEDNYENVRIEKLFNPFFFYIVIKK